MPLVLVALEREGCSGKIVVDDSTKTHLAKLGLWVEGTGSVLPSSGGPTVCRVKEGPHALDKNVAAHIYVA